MSVSYETPVRRKNGALARWIIFMSIVFWLIVFVGVSFLVWLVN